MAILYRKRDQFPTGASYMRFLVWCTVGFAIGGVTLIALGSIVFQPHHEAFDSHNIEAMVAWIGGCISVAISLLFSALSVCQYQRVKRMKEVTSAMLLDGQENTLYQVFHQTTPLPQKPLVMGAGNPAPGNDQI